MIIIFYANYIDNITLKCTALNTWASASYRKGVVHLSIINQVINNICYNNKTEYRYHVKICCVLIHISLHKNLVAGGGRDHIVATPQQATQLVVSMT